MKNQWYAASNNNNSNTLIVFGHVNGFKLFYNITIFMTEAYTRISREVTWCNAKSSVLFSEKSNSEEKQKFIKRLFEKELETP